MAQTTGSALDSTMDLDPALTMDLDPASTLDLALTKNKTKECICPTSKLF